MSDEQKETQQEPDSEPEVIMLRTPVTDDDWSLGPKDAPVEIVEYADYGCTECFYAAAAVEKLLEIEGDRVRLIFRHFPIMTKHPSALAQAKAAEAAGAQGKFWEMHHRLFSILGPVTDEQIMQFATDLGLDLERFKKDMASRRIEKKIRAQRLAGARSGVNGTPRFFFNGIMLQAPGTYEWLKAATDHFAQHHSLH